MLQFFFVCQQANPLRRAKRDDAQPPSRARPSGIANPSQIQLFVNVKFVLNLLYLDFEIVSDFEFRISCFLLTRIQNRVSSIVHHISRIEYPESSNDYAKQTQFP